MGPAKALIKAGWGSAARRPLLGSLLASGVGQLMLAVSGVIVARGLGPQDRGYFALLVLVPVMLAQATSLGIPLGITYYVARERSHAEQIAKRALAIAGLQVVAALVLQSVVFWALVRDDPRSVQIGAVIVLAVIPGLFAQQYGLAILQGQRRFTAFNILRSLPALLFAFGAVALALGGVDLISVAVLWAAVNLLSGAATVLAAARDLSLRQDAGSAPPNSKIVKFGLKAFLGSVSPIETFRLDQAAIGLFLTPVALGLYVVALAFTNLPRFVGQSIGMVAYPQVVSAPDPASAHRSMWKYVLVGIAAGGAVVAALEASVGWLLPLFFGDEFAGATTITRILLLGTLFVGVRRVLSDAANGAGHPGLGALAEASSWLSLAPTLAIFVPLWGVEGVAAALTVSWALSLAFLVVAVLIVERRARARTGETTWASKIAFLPRVSSELTVSVARSVMRAVKELPQRAIPAALLLAASLAAGFAVGRLPSRAALLLVLGVAAVAAFAFARGALAARDVLGRPVSPGAPRDLPESEGAFPDLRAARVLYYLGLVLIGQLIFRPIFPITISDWLFLASFLVACASLVVRRTSVLVDIPSALLWGIGVFSIGGVLSTFHSEAPVQSVAVVVRLLYLTVVWFWLGTVLLRKLSHLRTAVTLWVVSGAINGIAAIAQLVGGNVIPGSYVQWGRMSGFTAHVNDLGGMTSVAVAPALMLALWGVRFSRVVVGYLLLALVGAGLVLSGSVGGMLAAGVGLALWFAAYKLPARAIVLVVALAVGALVMFQLQASKDAPSPLQRIERVTGSSDDPRATLWSRVGTYRLALQRIEASPFIGVGLDDKSSTIGKSEVHNIVIGTWFKAGALGVAGILIAILAVARLGWRAVREAGSIEERTLALALLCAFVAFLAFAMGGPILFTRYGWVSAALLVALRTIQRRATVPAPRRTRHELLVVAPRGHAVDPST